MNSKIADKIFYGVLVVLVLVIVGLGSLFIHHRVKDEGSHLDWRIETQVIYLENSLPFDVSRMSAKGIRQAIEGANSSELVAVEIFDVLGNRIYVYERAGEGGAVYERVERRDLTRGGKVVGSFAAYFSKRQAMARFLKRELVSLILLISAVGLVVGGGIFIFERRIIVIPIEKTMEFSAALAAGNYSQRIKVTSRDEIGMLQESLNKMAASLEAYVGKLIEASRLKSEFLANLSHEIRTPMNAIVGFVDILMDDEEDKDRRELLSTIRQSAHILLETIDRVLQFSKMKSGEVKLSPSLFHVGALIEEIAPIVRQKITGKDVEFSWEEAPQFMEPFSCDRLALRQVLLNLLVNAAKFTQHGHIWLKAKVNESGGAVFEVSDTGMGIPKEDQERIFEPFTQVDASHTRQHGGTGLGLAISKQLVELMGGRIWLESKPGGGTTISFTVTMQFS